MNKILTPIVDKNGKSTRVWKKPEAGLTQSRLEKMMSGIPRQEVSFTKYSIANANAETVNRYFDEALIKDRLDDFGVDFASHPQLPAIYQTLLMHNDKTDQVADALVENPNASVGTIQRLYEEARTENSFIGAVVHPLLPIVIAESEEGYIASVSKNLPQWAGRAQAQLDRIEKQYS